MLKVKVELHPFGDSESAKEISSFFIANDGTGDYRVGNYLFKKEETDLWEPSIQNWPRHLPVEQLVKAVLEKHYG